MNGFVNRLLKNWTMLRTFQMPLVCVSFWLILKWQCVPELFSELKLAFAPPHDKTNKVACAPSEAQISLGIRPVWSESSLSAWRKLGSLAIHWAHSEDSDQSGRMPRLIWVFAGRTVILLVLSCRDSFVWRWSGRDPLKSFVGWTFENVVNE